MDRSTTHHLTLRFSPWNFFIKNNMIAILHPPYLPVTFLFSKLKIKLNDRHFGRNEVIKAALQAALKTLTE
jgi:hypothetical protein